MKRLLLAVAFAALFTPLAPHAQILAPERLDALFETQPQVEVNLRGSLLRLAAEAARAEDPGAGLMLDGLRAITVRVYPASTQRQGFVSRMDGLGSEFERDGWLTMVRVRALPESQNEEGDVWVYVRDDGDNFDGMAVMAIDAEDETAVFVHIDGTIRPSDVAQLTRRFGKVDIGMDDDDSDDESGDDDE